MDECGAPMVSICGGEPMMYPQIGELVAGILERDKNIYLCTNGMFIRSGCTSSHPDRRFFFNVHLDGLEKNHDIARRARRRVPRSDRRHPGRQASRFHGVHQHDHLQRDRHEGDRGAVRVPEQFDVDGHQLSPAYGYSAVNDREIFMTRDDIHEKFKEVDRMFQSASA